MQIVERSEHPQDGSLAAAAGPALAPDPAAEALGAASAASYMSFRVGELGLLFPASAGREVIPPPPVSRVPNTVAWLRGLANVRGELVPVVDLAAALGVARQPAVSRYLMIFGQGETAIGLLIDGLPRLFRLEQSERLADAPEIPALLAESLVSGYRHAGMRWLEVDPEILFDTLARHLAQH